MSGTDENKPGATLSLTILGDVRAESDHAMLDQVFLETPDYRTLLETSEGKVVVGRRGTGKSALMYRMARHWGKEKHTVLLSIAPDEDKVIGLRPLLGHFGDTFNLLRAGARLIWRYGIIVELLDRLASRYKASEIIGSAGVVSVHLKRWRSGGNDIFTKLRTTLRAELASGVRPEELIGDLASNLQLRDLEAVLKVALEEGKYQCVVLIDKLDEGYQYDNVGIALVDGVIYGLSDVEDSVRSVKALIFLRDNIFRAIATTDPDYSRNIEGQTLRLHWDTYQLFNMVCNRLRAAFSLDIENNQRLWDRCTANELQHQDGFKRCLQLTLYRPRDILILLNHAFYNAARESRGQIVLKDIETSAQHISSSRLADLYKEYEAIFPGLIKLTNAFHGRNPEISVAEAKGLLGPLLAQDDFSVEIQQDFAIFPEAQDQLRRLYSVGFVGVQDKDTVSFVFCHDGRQPDREFHADDRILIHPCYWLALNMTRNTLNPQEAEEIYDEYEIAITSQTPQIRNHRIGQIISSLDQILPGDEGAAPFEEWCCEAIRIAFAGKLRNVQLHPNRNAVQRRDVVATNLSTKGAWKRIYDDYKTRQVIFEVKNYGGIGLNEYRQLHSYLCDDYGKMGFIVTRDDTHTLSKEVELTHFLEMWNKHKVLIVKLTGKLLCTLLSKLRSPQRHDEPDNLLNKLLDTYSRQYMSGVSEKRKK